MKKGNQIRCSICGKFIAYKDFIEDKIKTLFVPDTYYTEERTEFSHKECIIKNNTKSKNETI